MPNAKGNNGCQFVLDVSGGEENNKNGGRANPGGEDFGNQSRFEKNRNSSEILKTNSQNRKISSAEHQNMNKQ